MANNISKIAEGLAAWLTFERRCGRYNLFSESYLAYPLAQLFRHRFPGRVHVEIEHAVLAESKTGPGSKPRVDFGITAGAQYPEFSLVAETKWLSGSPTLVRDMIRDIIRLDLLVPEYAQGGMLVVAGQSRRFTQLLQSAEFLKPSPLLPTSSVTGTLNLQNPAPHRREFLKKVLSAFDGLRVSTTIPITRAGPFPSNARTRDYQVYVWALRSFSGEGPRFTVNPEELYGSGESS